MSRPSVLIISFSNISSDARVLKQVRLLAEHYDVTTCGHGPLPDGAVGHIEIPADRQAWRKDQKLLLQRRYQDVYNTNEAVTYARRHMKPGTFDAILANDVEAVPLALALRPRFGVHADLHEYAPGQNTELLRWRAFVAPYLRWLCRTYVTRANSVTTVGAEIARRYTRELGVPVGVVMNAAPYADLTPTPVGAGPIWLVHSGNAMRSRGLATLINAVEEANADLTLDLYLMPNEPDHLAELQEMADVSSRVRVLAPVPYSRLVATLNGYDVGVHVLPPVNFNNRWALPNKFFDYVQARLGILVGPSPEMAALIDEYGLGAVAGGFGADAVARALESVTREQVTAWKQASDRAAQGLSAQTQSVGWLDAIRAILENGPGDGGSRAGDLDDGGLRGARAQVADASRFAGSRGRAALAGAAAVASKQGRVVASHLAAFPRVLAGRVIRSRSTLPAFVGRGIDHIADHPDSLVGKAAARALGGGGDAPAPTVAPDADIRVLIGPTNYAGQGWAWAQALDRVPDTSGRSIGARNLAVAIPGGFTFAAGTTVPVAVYRASATWQRAERAAAGHFTHVLYEAERPLFGGLFTDVEAEARALEQAGLSTAFICHGTDIRLPSRHADLTPWSHHRDRDASTERHEREARRNRGLLDRMGRPVFVSTPDLLADVPYATWCPVVVDPHRWATDVPVGTRARPVVVHVPTNPRVKGTALIHDAMCRLHDAGVIEYREVQGVPAAAMPRVYAAADIVLDQFRVGTYGVAACEAMAAGRVVIGHVLDPIRAEVSRLGATLPVQEATPDTIAEVVTRLAADHDQLRDLGAAGVAYVRDMHDGARSARVLLDHWITKDA